MEKIRSFIAVLLPPEIRERVAGIEKSLMSSGADVKWVPEENLHVTLKFLGYVEQRKMEAVARAVEAALEGFPPFDITLCGVGAFPRPTSPSVVWVGVSDGARTLKALAERIESAMESEGFARETKEFRSHITVGRVRSRHGADRLKEQIDRLREECAGSFRVESVAVMKSDLRPTGPVYTSIAEIRLD